MSVHVQVAVDLSSAGGPIRCPCSRRRGFRRHGVTSAAALMRQQHGSSHNQCTAWPVAVLSPSIY